MAFEKEPPINSYRTRIKRNDRKINWHSIVPNSQTMELFTLKSTIHWCVDNTDSTK